MNDILEKSRCLSNYEENLSKYITILSCEQNKEILNKINNYLINELLILKNYNKKTRILLKENINILEESYYYKKVVEELENELFIEEECLKLLKKVFNKKINIIPMLYLIIEVIKQIQIEREIYLKNSIEKFYSFKTIVNLSDISDRFKNVEFLRSCANELEKLNKVKKKTL